VTVTIFGLTGRLSSFTTPAPASVFWRYDSIPRVNGRLCYK
jgi:hypothetical protein